MFAIHVFHSPATRAEHLVGIRSSSSNITPQILQLHHQAHAPNSPAYWYFDTGDIIWTEKITRKCTSGVIVDTGALYSGGHRTKYEQRFSTLSAMIVVSLSLYKKVAKLYFRLSHKDPVFTPPLRESGPFLVTIVSSSGRESPHPRPLTFG